MRRKICAFTPAGDLKDYSVIISFATYVGSEEEFNVFAHNEEEASEQALEDARGELNLEDVVQIDDDEWEVTIQWAGFIGIEETYTVTADSEEDAVDQAIEEASWDLSVDEVEEA